MISIVIPTYNSEETISDCLDSIYKSKYKDFEVIVVDDGSTDNTAKVAKNFPAKVIELRENKGAGFARNKGASDARGDIVLFLDSDCLMEENALKLLDETFKLTKADAVVGNYSVTGAYNDFSSKFQNLFTYQSHYVPDGRIYWFWTAVGAIRKNVFEKIDGFTERYARASAEDMKMGHDLVTRDYTIYLNKNIQAVHKHRFDFVSVLKNDYRKSRDFTSLVLKTRHHFRHKSTSFQNFLRIFSVYASLATIVSASLRLVSLWVPILFLVFFVTLSLGLYKLVLKEGGTLLLLKAVLFHYIVNIAIGLGALAGLIDYTTKRR